MRELVMLIENEQERFYRIAYSYVKNQEDALDIVHNAIVKALQSSRGLRTAGSGRAVPRAAVPGVSHPRQYQIY